MSAQRRPAAARLRPLTVLVLALVAALVAPAAAQAAPAAAAPVQRAAGQLPPGFEPINPVRQSTEYRGVTVLLGDGTPVAGCMAVERLTFARTTPHYEELRVRSVRTWAQNASTQKRHERPKVWAFRGAAYDSASSTALLRHSIPASCNQVEKALNNGPAAAATVAGSGMLSASWWRVALAEAAGFAAQFVTTVGVMAMFAAMEVLTGTEFAGAMTTAIAGCVGGAVHTAVYLLILQGRIGGDAGAGAAVGCIIGVLETLGLTNIEPIVSYIKAGFARTVGQLLDVAVVAQGWIRAALGRLGPQLLRVQEMINAAVQEMHVPVRTSQAF